MTTEIEQKLLEIAMSSPALESRVKWWNKKAAYPPSWKDKVPLKIKMTTTVLPDLPRMFRSENMTAEVEKEYYAYVNSFGAVSAIISPQEQLGLRPNEFKVVSWHQQKGGEQ